MSAINSSVKTVLLQAWKTDCIVCLFYQVAYVLLTKQQCHSVSAQVTAGNTDSCH